MNKQKSIFGDDETLEYRHTVVLNDGWHNGTIKTLNRELRNDFDYIDIIIDTENNKEEKLKIKVSVPTNLSNLSELGKILQKSDFIMKDGDKIELNTIATHLIGKDVKFRSETEKTEKGEFYRVDISSINFL